MDVHSKLQIPFLVQHVGRKVIHYPGEQTRTQSIARNPLPGTQATLKYELSADLPQGQFTVTGFTG